MANTQGPLAACLQHVAGLPPPDLAMPALEPVKNRETYRVRGDNELEEAVWYSAEEPDTLVEPTKTKLRSIHSKQATVITFNNKSAHRVRALWIDFSGNEVVYSVLEPGSTRRYHTYCTHPWIVRELKSGTRMLLSGSPAVVGLTAEQTVEITAPPQLKWSLDTFSCFPETYKSSMQGLLLAHKALEQCALQVPTLQPIKLTPPCSPTPAVPCSPRATLNLQGALPTSPKAPRLSMPPVPASPAAATCHTPRTPRGAAAGSPAGSSEAATSTTSISISHATSHFQATLTVSSPTRAMLQQTVNIEVFNNPAGSNTTFNIGTQLSKAPGSAGPSRDSVSVMDQGTCLAASSSSSGRPSRHSSSKAESASRRSSWPKSGLFNNLVHSFKHAFRPVTRHIPDPTTHSSLQAPGTTHITLHLSQLLAGVVSEPQPMEVDEPTAPWPPVGTHLGHLPSHLLVAIAELAAPVAWQTLDQCPKGRPDIKPTLLACPPKTAEEQAAEEEQQQQQQQQQQQNGAAGNDDDDMPALI